MALQIRTTGLEEYAPGGKARLKLMNIGGPGAGKTRMASFWPKPIWADCEGGLASVADRNVPYASINTSDDMLDFLAFLARESAKPDAQRQYLTVVIDTLDAFQRKVKDEWLQKNPSSQSFRGFEAWGYLDSKMQMLLTRLLNLDMNVIVNVHYKEKTIKEGSGTEAAERQELMLQLSGDVKDSAFNDFDLVAWMGTFWVAGQDGREQRRGLTFNATPEKPFLKDRLHFTPKWFEVTFTDEDYLGLFSLLQVRLDAIRAEAGQGGEVVGEIPTAQDFRPDSSNVVSPDAARGGALQPQDPRDIPLGQYGKPELQGFARLLEIPFKGNTLKSELVTAIEAKGGMDAVVKAREAGQAAAAEAAKPEATVVESGPVALEATVEGRAAAAEQRVEAVATTDTVDVSAVAAGEGVLEDEPTCDAPSGYAGVAACGYDKGHDEKLGHSWTRAVADLSQAITQPTVTEGTAARPVGTPSDPTPVETAETEVGQVDTATGEVVSEGTVESVAAALGGSVVEVVEEPVQAAPTPQVTPEVVPTPAPAATAPTAVEGDGHNCGYIGCGKALGGADENQDYVKLSRIKFLVRLCNTHFVECKKSGKSAAQLKSDSVIA